MASACLAAGGWACGEKLQVVVDYVRPLVDTDVSSGPYQSVNDRGDIYLHLEVTPQNGMTRELETDVVDDALLGSRLFEGHRFPTLSVPPRVLTVSWEVRDRDGEAFHVLASGSKTINPDGESESWQQLAYGAEAQLGLTVRWMADWDRLFGVVCNPEDGCLDLDKFAQGIDDRFGPAAAKYGYRIQVGLAVRENAMGVGRSSADAPAVANFGLDDRFNPASMTKTVTAVALLRAMEEKGVSLDASVADYLPSYWDIPETIEILTFRELLSHHSGLEGAAATLPQLRSKIEEGANLWVKLFSYANGGFDYENINYALCRVLLVYVLGFEDSYYATNPPYWEALHANQISFIYQDYLRTEIFEPIGIYDVNFTPAAGSTLFYPNPASGNGTSFDNWAGREGYAGVQLSLREYAKFQLHLWNSDTYVSEAMLNQMKSSRLGMFEFMGVNDGLAYGHNGWFPAGGWNKDGIMAEVQTCHLRFANGVQVVWMINGNASMPSAVAAVIAAYNEAWYEPGLTVEKAVGNLVLTKVSGSSVESFTQSELSRAMGQAERDPSLARQIAGIRELVGGEGSALEITGFSRDERAGTCLLEWRSEPGRVCRVYSSADLRGWSPVGREVGVGASGQMQVELPATESSAYFKVLGRMSQEQQVEAAEDLLKSLGTLPIRRMALAE